MIIVLPFVQLLILVYAATFDLKHTDINIVDQDMSGLSRQLISKFDGSPFFDLKPSVFSLKEAEEEMKRDKTDVILNIPKGFEKNLMRGEKAKIQLLINSINATTAGLSSAYANNVLFDFNRNIVSENISSIDVVPTKRIQVDYSFWYNPELNYKIYMLPGILVILVSLIGIFLSAINIVREKEMGTIEQLNVTPISKLQFIAGKLIPFWIIAMGELAFGLSLGKLLFDIPILGSLWVLFGFAGVYLLVALGFGLLVSTVAKTQQQVMFLLFFFQLTFILMSGIFTPVESMPDWALIVNKINPFAYFMRVIRMILLKGSGFSDISYEFFSLLVYGILLISLAIWRHRKTV